MRSTAFLPVVLALACVSSALAGTEEKALEQGAKVYVSACLECHKGDKQPIEHLRMSRGKWKEAIDRMIDSSFLEQMPSKANLGLLLDYLEKTHGPDAPPASAK